MKKLLLVMTILGSFALITSGQNANGCTGGVRNGNVYTDCWTDAADDTSRLQSALSTQVGKVIFNESNYSISDSLVIHSYRSIEGTTSNPFTTYGGSNITQTTNNKPIFTIGEGILNVTIQKLALVAGSGTSGTVGIKASGTNGSSQNFHFTNLSFNGLDKGIYVEANNGQYQFDNIRLEHSYFGHCNYGVHVNSWNSGWNIESINIDAKSGGIGFYFQKSTYTSINLVIGNANTGGSGYGDKLFWIKEHGNLTIQNSVSEHFNEDINIDALAHSGQIHLINNHFNGDVTVKNAIVYSHGNSFVYPGASTSVDAIAKGTAYIYTYGDRFCSYDNPCSDGWQVESSSSGRIAYEVGLFKNTMTVATSILRDPTDANPNLSILAPTNAPGSLLRLGRGSFYYDITRKEGSSAEAGYLEFQGNQSGFGGYSFKTQGGTVLVNYNGSVTYGSAAYSGLGAPTNGTVIYCSDCQKTTPCLGSGSGALAKRINGSWDCD